MAIHIDPYLLAEISNPSSENGLIQAIGILDLAIACEDFDSTIESIMTRIETQLQQKPIALVLFRNIHAFSIEASPAFIQQLLNDARVYSVALN